MGFLKRIGHDITSGAKSAGHDITSAPKAIGSTASSAVKQLKNNPKRALGIFGLEAEAEVLPSITGMLGGALGGAVGTAVGGPGGTVAGEGIGGGVGRIFGGDIAEAPKATLKKKYGVTIAKPKNSLGSDVFWGGLSMALGGPGAAIGYGIDAGAAVAHMIHHGPHHDIQSGPNPRKASAMSAYRRI